MLRLILGAPKPMRFLTIVTAAASLSGPASAASFGGYECTLDCAGHEAGYAWADANRITAASECPDGNSPSFLEGCRARAEGSIGLSMGGSQADAEDE